MTRNRMRESPRPGLEPRAAAARTKPLYVGRPPYQLSSLGGWMSETDTGLSPRRPDVSM